MLVYQRVMLNTPGNSVVVIQFRKVHMVHIIGTMGSGTMTVLAVCKGTTTTIVKSTIYGEKSS